MIWWYTVLSCLNLITEEISLTAYGAARLLSKKNEQMTCTVKFKGGTIWLAVLNVSLVNTFPDSLHPVVWHICESRVNLKSVLYVQLYVLSP